MTALIDLPARRSVSDDDFDPIYFGTRVFVDGVEQRNVMSYDIDAGRVTRCAQDARGHLIIRDDEVVTEVVTGCVKVSHPLNGDGQA